jgi:hypothetical protein
MRSPTAHGWGKTSLTQESVRAIAYCFLLPIPYFLFFLSTPKNTKKQRIPNKDAAI